MLDVLNEIELKENLIGISPDNTNLNFGGKKRKGKNNIYYRIEENLVNNLIKIGCPTHIVHNVVHLFRQVHTVVIIKCM